MISVDKLQREPGVDRLLCAEALAEQGHRGGALVFD